MHASSRSIPLLALLLAVPASLSSSEGLLRGIDRLREQAEEIDALAEEEGKDFYDVTLRTVQPGTGPQLTTLRLYFGEYRESEEEIYGTYYLRKVLAAYNVAGREFRSEYLFANPTAPQLIFYLGRESRGETRIYFDDGQPISVGHTKSPGEADLVPDTGHSPESDLERSHGALKRARRYLELFTQLERTLEAERGY